VKKNSFKLLELEMADLERFWRKTPLGPLGVKKYEHGKMNTTFVEKIESKIEYLWRSMPTN
jgi:hypothetical protein